MLFRLVVTAALLFTGLPTVDVMREALVRIPPSSTTATVTSDPAGEAADSVATLDEIAVVVPAVDPASGVVSTPEPDATGDGVIVTDQIAADGRIESAVVETDDFQTVGVTWPDGGDGADVDAQVRTRVEGEWSEWVPLPVADDAPDAGTADADESVRAGTDAVWVGDADAVQLSFSASTEGGPDDMRLALISSEAAPADATVDPAVQQSRSTGEAVVSTAALRTSAASASVQDASFAAATVPTAVLPAATAAPQIISRGEWGARPQVCTPDVASRLVGAVVHHTAGSNSYSTVAEAMQQIRNDQAYHIDGRGWCDLGYNFVVDKWGNIYEGRAGSATQPVIGVHAGGFNTATVGISMLGNYSSVTPSPATIDAVAKVAAWRLAAYGVDPQGSISYHTLGGENSKIPAGTTISLPAIFAHRDVANTACPGQAGYNQMGVIRQSAGSFDYAQRLASAMSIVKSLYRDILGRDADAGGLQSWSAGIVQGMSVAQVGQALSQSPEYAYATVARNYRDVLGREPDPSGISTWTSAIISGAMRSEDLNIWLYSSVEYFNISGQTNDLYVSALYRKILGREPGASDTQFWAPLVSVHGQDAVVRGFWGSGESANVRVQAFYQRYLSRGADPQGMTTWPTILLQRGEGELRDQLVGSVEYFNRARAAFP